MKWRQVEKEEFYKEVAHRTAIPASSTAVAHTRPCFKRDWVGLLGW